MTTNPPEIVALVAEAIAEEADHLYWSLLTIEEREPYLERARVAIDALNLTGEWGVRRDGVVITGHPGPLSAEEASDLERLYRRKATRVHRYASPWVASSTPGEDTEQ